MISFRGELDLDKKEGGTRNRLLAQGEETDRLPGGQDL